MTQNNEIKTSNYSIDGMTCEGCVKSITDMLLSIDEIVSVEISLQARSATINHTNVLDLSRLNQIIAELGSYRIFDKNLIPLEILNRPAVSVPNPMSLSVLKPLLIALCIVTLISISLQIPKPEIKLEEFLPDFMGSFFFIFSLFKLANVKGFANSFKKYDVLAKNIPLFGIMYPFIELILGFCYYADLWLLPINLITFFLMSSQTIGISSALLKKTNIQCACLGSTFNIPITPITLIENLVMALMALGMVIIIVY